MGLLLNGKPQIASYRLPVVKVGSGAQLDVELRTESVVVVATHWLGGRTLLCADDSGECPGCMVSTPRLAGFTIVRALEKRGSRVGLLEFTGVAVADFFMGLPKPMVGTLLRCRRPGERVGLRFERLGRQAEMFSEALPPFRLLQALATLFAVDLPGVNDSPQAWIERTQSRRLHLLKEAAGRD